MPRMKSQSIALASLGMAVVAALVVLAVVASSSRGPGVSAAAPAVKAGPRVPTPDIAPVGSPQARPALAPASSAAQTAADDPAAPTVHRYVRDDGTVVRDHRGRNAAPIPERSRKPHKVVTTSVQTVMAVRDAVRPIVRRCEGRYVTARQGNPRLQAVVTVSIKNNRLTVDRADVKAAGVDADGIVPCVRSAVSALVLSVHDRDVSGHAITLPFRLHGDAHGT